MAKPWGSSLCTKDSKIRLTHGVKNILFAGKKKRWNGTKNGQRETLQRVTFFSEPLDGWQCCSFFAVQGGDDNFATCRRFSSSGSYYRLSRSRGGVFFWFRNRIPWILDEKQRVRGRTGRNRRQNRNASGWTLQVGRRETNTRQWRRRTRREEDDEEEEEEGEAEEEEEEEKPTKRCIEITERLEEVQEEGDCLCTRRQRTRQCTSFTRLERSLPPYRTFRDCDVPVCKTLVRLETLVSI